MASEVPWIQTAAGFIGGAAVPIAAYWFTREGGSKPKLEADAQRFAFDALQQIVDTRGDEIDRLSAAVEKLMGEVRQLRRDVSECERKHSLAEQALSAAGIAYPG